MSSSSASSSPVDPSTPIPEGTAQPPTTPIPAALVEHVGNLDQNADSEQDMEHVGAAAFAAHPGTDGDSEASFWDIIADSHMKLESYADQSYDQEMAEPPAGFLSPGQSMTATATSMSLVSSSSPSTNLPAVYDNLLSGGELPPSPLLHPSYSGFSAPTHCITFESRQDGTPFPLSKPIVREDGLLLVGTEAIADPSTPTAEKNRIFVTNFLSSTGATQPPAHIVVEHEVRDIQWMESQAAIVAIGKEIHLIQLGDLAIGGPCRLQDPINTVHSDTIRELAVSPTRISYVLSGGFDETVVLTDLRNRGDPKAAAVIGKFDAYDVVSSVRWSPTDSHVSWTTDGGDFQVADTRARSPQLQVPLYTFLQVDSLGGLYTHEYLSSFDVALGFERGHIAYVDLRMPRQTCCTSLIESKLTSTGEIRRSKSDKFALFGRGGFSVANLNRTTSNFEQITPHRRQSLTSYKTSGDFSYEGGMYLAVSDNMGIVAVYTDDTVFGSSPSFNGSSAGW